MAVGITLSMGSAIWSTLGAVSATEGAGRPGSIRPSSSIPHADRRARASAANRVEEGAIRRRMESSFNSPDARLRPVSPEATSAH